MTLPGNIDANKLQAAAWFRQVRDDLCARLEKIEDEGGAQVEGAPGRFDIILCRNVLLYLSPALRRHVFDRLAEVARPGALLVLGAGETVIGQTESFRPSPQYRGLYEPTGFLASTHAAAR